MSDRPILFSAPMVRALLDGRKTQTRRVMKPQPDDLCEGQIPNQLRTSIGDSLWVREAWKPHSLYDHMPPRDMPITNVFYLADGGYSPSGTRGRPGIHMPRWASRLTLIVTDVRVQRLQQITLGDICAEGLARSIYEFKPVQQGFDAWAQLWDEINGPGAWDANPWVAAYTFTVHRHNIDAEVA